MKFKLKDYRGRKEEVIKTYRQKGISHISFYCSVASIPLLAAYSYINEEMPSKEVQDKIKVLIEFYEIYEIVEE
jgi:hypothetical protein